MRFSSLFGIFIPALTVLALCPVLAQETLTPSDSFRPPRLEPVFSDDFAIDSRAAYKIEGEVSWEPGSLKLEEGTSVERDINGGPWAKVELDLDWPKLETEEDAERSELRVWFILEGATNCFVRLFAESKDGAPTLTVALVDTGEQDGRRVEEVVRESTIAIRVPKHLVINYRHGLVTVGTVDTESLLVAHIENGDATCSTIRLNSREQTIQLSGFSAAAKKRKTTLFSEVQKQQLADADQANARMFQLYRAGDRPEATRIGEQVLEVRKRILGEEHPAYALSLYNLARLYQSMGEYARAEPLHLKARDVRRKVLGEQHPSYASSLNSLAGLYQSMGEYARAEPLYLEARVIWKKVLGEQHPDYAYSLNNLAMLYEAMGEYARVEPLLLEARDIRRNVLGGEHPDYAHSLNNLAMLYESMGEYARAEPLLLEAREIWKKVLGEQHPDYAISLNNLAMLYESMGEYARAEPLYLEAREIWKKVLGDEHPDYATCLVNLALLYESMGEYARAEPLYLEAREIYKEALGEQHPLFAQSLNNLALLYESMGEYARAEPLFLRVREIDKEALGEQHPDYAYSLNNLAMLYEAMGEYARVEPLLLETHEIWKKVLGEQHPDYALSLNNLAGLYKSMGEYARAESLYLETHEIWKKVLGEQHPDYALSLNNLAGLYESMGEYARAEPLYLEARDIWKKVLGEQHPLFAQSLNNLAMLYQSMGEYARAEPLHLAAFNGQANNTVRSLDALSEAQALSWMESNGPRLGMVLASLRRIEQKDSFMAYQTIWQTKSAVSRLRVNQSPGEEASGQALEVFGRLRDARLRLAKLVSATPDPERSEDYRRSLAEASEAKERLEKELASVNPATERALAIRDASIEQLQSRLPAGVAVIDFIQVDDLDFIEREITLTDTDGSAETRAVKRVQATPVYDAFVLRAGGQKEAAWIELGDAEPINSAIAAWRGQLTGGGVDRSLGDESVPVEDMAGTDAAAELRQLVWSKLDDHLDGCHTVIILPDGDLNRVPWSALPGREPGSYLIENYAVVTANYGQQLFGLLSDDSPSVNSLLVAGGILYDEKPLTGQTVTEQIGNRNIEVSEEDRHWSYLTGAEQEAAAISALWKSRGEISSLYGIEANEVSVSELLEKSRYAHLATHGFFDTEAEIYRVNLRTQSLFEAATSGDRQGASVAARNPLLMTGVVLAGANVEPEKDDIGLPVGSDGILTAEEIVGLNLRNLDLVTLSACETGLGDVAAGEGVFGLQRAFHQAGARSVVASLWKVNDKATEKLMIEFYKNLWDKEMSKVEALRQAQLTMIQSYDPESGQLRSIGNRAGRPDGGDSNSRLSPRYWAAFQISGDWR